jgi:hypothetical protein
MKLREKKHLRGVEGSPHGKEIKDFIRTLEELVKKGELDYTKDPFWSLEPVDLGKTDSSKLEHILY